MRNLKLFLFFTVMFGSAKSFIWASKCCSTFALPPHSFSEPISIESAKELLLDRLIEYNKNQLLSKELLAALDKLVENYSSFKINPNIPCPELLDALMEVSADVSLSLANATFECEKTTERACRNPQIDGSKDYRLKLYGLYVSTVEVGNDEYQGNRLLEFALPLVKLTKERIIAMHSARDALDHDICVANAYGLSIRKPTGMPRAYRFPGNQQRLDMNLEGSEEDFPKEVLVSTTDFTLGESEYGDDLIYQKGDLLRALNNMNLFELCKSIVTKKTETSRGNSLTKLTAIKNKYDAVNCFTEMLATENI